MGDQRRYRLWMLDSITDTDIHAVVGPRGEVGAVTNLDTAPRGRVIVTIDGHALDIQEDRLRGGSILGWTMTLTSRSGARQPKAHLCDRDQVLRVVAAYARRAAGSA